MAPWDCRWPRNLLANGFTVTGYDLNAAALDALEGAGGKRAESAAEAAAEADVLILMVVNAAQAEAVLFEGGALEALRTDGVVALMATCPPSAVEAINERVLKAGRRLIDCACIGRGRGREGGNAHDHGRRAKGHVRCGEAGF